MVNVLSGWGYGVSDMGIRSLPLYMRLWEKPGMKRDNCEREESCGMHKGPTRKRKREKG